MFRSSTVNDVYQKIKEEKLGISKCKYNEILCDIRTIFNKKLSYLFTNDSKENHITDKYYIQLFNFLFDKKSKLPQTFNLRDTVTIIKVRETLLKELHNSTINLKPLFKNPLEIDTTFNDILKIPAYSKVTNKNIKGALKYLMVEKTNNYNLSTAYKLSNSQLEVFIDSHVLHYKTGNVQTEKYKFGTYQEIFQKILNNETHKKNIVIRIFEVIQNKERDHTIELPKKLNHFAEQLAHLLFIIEMQRNNATLFTAPMFLELVNQDSKYLREEEFFPMSAKTAVSQARGVSYDNPFELPNTHFMDYDINNIKNSALLLKNEGHIVIEWFTQIVKNNKLSFIGKIFNVITLVNITKNKGVEDINLINIQELQDLVKSVNSINYSNNLIKPLEEHLNNLILHFGNRPEQYLLLFKEALLKKTIFSEKVKNLIETTFFEFEKILPKLDSFLATVQENLEEDIKQIIPEILKILCAKIKEWYNIDAPDYITNTKTVEETNNKEVLKDITLKFNQTTSPISSKTRLKFSLSSGKKREREEKENSYDSNKFLKTYDENLDKSIEEALKLIGVGENLDDSISC